MNPRRWSGLAALPVAALLAAEIARSEDPIFWSGAAVLCLLATIAFCWLIYLPVSALDHENSNPDASIGSVRAWGGLAVLAALCGAAIVLQKGSPFLAHFYLAYLLTVALKPAGGFRTAAG